MSKDTDQAPAEGAEEAESPAPSLAKQAWDQIWPLAVAVLIALGIRAVVIESYYVPSGSMFPTLLSGDHVFVRSMGRCASQRLLHSNIDCIVLKFLNVEKVAQRFTRQILFTSSGAFRHIC